MALISLTVFVFLLVTSAHAQGSARRPRVVEITDISLYDGEDIDEFLSLCYYPHSQLILDPDDFEQYYDATNISGTFLGSDGIPDKRCPTLDVGIHSGMSQQDIHEHIAERFEDLRRVQHLIRTYNQIVHTTHHYWVGAILLSCVVAGGYLVVVGHYHWRTLIDPFHSDGSHGVPCWQYLSMRYVAAKVRRNTTNKTLLVPIFEFTSAGHKEKVNNVSDKTKEKGSKGKIKWPSFAFKKVT